MKVTGLTLEQVQDAAKSCGMTFIGKTLANSVPTLDGYLNAKGTPYASHLAGKSHYGPCVCGFKAFRKALKNADLSGWTFTVHKHKVASWSGYSGAVKIEVACSKAGVTCVHAGATTPSAYDASTIAAAPAPPEQKVPWDVPALVGDPLTDGTVTASDYTALGARRPVFAITASLYVLEEMYVAAQALQVPTLSADVPDSQLADYHARITWARKLVLMRREFGKTLARNFLDYLVLASYSECRASASGYGSRYTFASADSRSGGTINPESFKFDPRSLLPRMARAFRTHKGPASYGGEKWAKICDAAGLYFTLGRCPTAFADHVVDLAHNGGLAFNKGYIISNPRSESDYQAMLTAKRNGSLLAGKVMIELTPEVAALLQDAIACGVMASPRCPIKVTEDNQVPFVAWGNKEFVVYKGKHAPADASEPDASEPTVTPTSYAIGGDGMATLAPERS